MFEPHPRHRLHPALGLPHPDRLTSTSRTPGIASATHVQRQQYQRFRWRILPAEAELLTLTARQILDEHGIDEPVQWAPRLDTASLRRLQLPGPDPGSITVAQLHQALPCEDFSIARLAQALNTTTAHVIYLPSRHPVDWSPPRFRRTQRTATRVGQWRTWYEHDHLSLQDIADREGTSLATVRLALLQNDTPLRPAGSYPGLDLAPVSGDGLGHCVGVGRQDQVSDVGFERARVDQEPRIPNRPGDRTDWTTRFLVA